MRTVFIVNPKAGQGKGNKKFTERIRHVAEKAGTAVEIYTTAGIGDAEILARQIAEESNAEPTRIYACGGDGTLNEVLNGVLHAGCEGGAGSKGNEECESGADIAIGVVPIGTGNDFCRNFPEAADFTDIEAQLAAEPKRCDAIKYSGILAGKEQTRYCANMFNIGFDCNVVDLTATLKTYPLLSGSLAYLMAVLAILVKKKGANLKVEVDGKVKHDGPLLLTAVANGCFCGGGVKSSPMASISDGLMDINIIYNVKRMEFLKKFPYYSKGTHMELPDISKILYAAQAKKIVIMPNDGTMRLCADGEIVDAGRVEMEIVHEAFTFLVPKGEKENDD